MPKGGPGDMVLCTVKKGKPEFARRCSKVSSSARRRLGAVVRASSSISRTTLVSSSTTRA